MTDPEPKQKIRNFTDLIAWQEGHKLVLEIYKVTRSFPIEERFALSDQLKRAAVSVTSNIAEGFSRKTAKDKIHFYKIAQGSLTELQNQLIIARDVGFVGSKWYENLAEQAITVHKLLSGLAKATKNLNY